MGLSIIHVLIHAVDDLDDLTVQAPNEAVLNGANFDQTGAVVAIQNTIAQEMGWTQNHQVSYLGAVTSTDPTASDLQMGLSYTEFHTVETVRIGAWFPNKTGVSDYIDHSLNTVRTKDLILAWDGADTIYAGAGDDYVYGGRGEDKIVGGAGDDLIHGGDPSLTEAQDGYDVVDYSQIASNQNATGGVTVDFNFQDPLSYLGQQAISRGPRLRPIPSSNGTSIHSRGFERAAEGAAARGSVMTDIAPKAEAKAARAVHASNWPSPWSRSRTRRRQC